MDRIRIGIIGTGIMADLYAKIYSAHPLSQVVAVCSRTQAKVDAFLSRHQGTNGYTDYRTMLEGSDLDAVVIATPDHHHFAPAQAVLESGRHAFVEKPFTTSVAEADELIRIAGKVKKEVLRARGIDTYDIIQAQVRFASGAIVTFESAWIYPNTFPSIVDSFIEVLGSAGHIHLDRKCESVELSTEKKFSYPKGFLNLEIFGRMRGAFPSCLEDFLYAILDDTEPKVTAWDGRQVTATLEAIHRSLESGADEKIATKPVGRETYARS